MIIKTSKGEVRLKESLTVKDYYELQCAEQDAMSLNDKGVNVTGQAVRKLKEFKALFVIEKIVINQKEKEINLNTLLNDDWFTIQDFKKVFEAAFSHITKLQSKTNPSKKS